jgi:hypothetical protein
MIEMEVEPESNIIHLAGTYIPDHIPADWDLAKAHAEAVLPGKRKDGCIEACPCCMGYIEKAHVGYCENTKELAFLGEGFPLFYNFIKFGMVMLVILILDESIVGILISTNENNCD